MDNNREEPNESNSISDHTSVIMESLLKSLINKCIQETTSAECLAEFSNTNKTQAESSPQPRGATTSTSETTTNYPNTLYSLTLVKIQEDSLRRAAQIIADNNQNVQQFHYGPINSHGSKISGSDLKTPDSLGAAPPSYSFVLRQASQPRPRLMGTFIPSPSFVMHTPPPNYATAFDIYIDNLMPNPTRTYRFGYMPMYIICPECGYIGVTTVVTKIIMSTHLCALILCLLCCWACAPLPYVLRSCKEVHHYCTNCRVYLGMYNPTNPENTTTRT